MCKGDKSGILDVLSHYPNIREASVLKDANGIVELEIHLPRGIDIRDELFFAMAERRYAVINIEQKTIKNPPDCTPGDFLKCSFVREFEFLRRLRRRAFCELNEIPVLPDADPTGYRDHQPHHIGCRDRQPHHLGCRDYPDIAL